MFEALNRKLSNSSIALCKLGECENRFNELTKDKLQLEIGLRDRKFVSNKPSRPFAFSAVRLRFENRDSDALFTKELRLVFILRIVDVRPAADIFAVLNN